MVPLLQAVGASSSGPWDTFFPTFSFPRLFLPRPRPFRIQRAPGAYPAFPDYCTGYQRDPKRSDTKDPSGV